MEQPRSQALVRGRRKESLVHTALVILHAPLPYLLLPLLIHIHTPCPLRYVFAKTTRSGLTSFYALYLNTTQQTAYFEYRHESLDEGFRTISLPQVNLADGQFHHIAVAVFGNDFALYIDGRLRSPRRTLIAALEDGPGILFLGRRVQRPSRFAGTLLSVVSISV